MNLNQSLRALVFGGLFLIPFIPFFVSSSLLFPFITGKNFAFRIIVEILFVLWAVLALRDNDYRPKFSWLFVAFAFFTAIMAVADIFAVNPSKAFWSNFERMEGFLTLFHLFLYFIVMSSMFHVQKLWNRFWGTWIGVNLLMCFYGTFQLAGKLTINQGGVRVDGTLGNATYLAVFLLFGIFINLFLFLRASNKKMALGFLGPILIYQLVILYFTATRGAILGLLGGLFVSLILVALFERENKFMRTVSLGLLAGIVLFVSGFVAIRNTTFVKESPVLSRFASLSVSEIKTQGRFFIWPMALQGVKEKPILGWGQEGFSYIFNSHYNPKMYAQEQWFDRAHSAPLDWLVAGGVLGFLGYFSLLFFGFWYIWRSKNAVFSFTEKSLLTGLLAGYVFQSIFVFDNLISYILFVGVLAMIHAMNGGNHIHIPESARSNTFQTILAVILSIVLVWSIYFLNFKPIRAGQTLIQALQTMQQPSDETLRLFKKSLSYNSMGNPEIREQLANAAPTVLENQSVSVTVKNEYIELVRSEYLKQIEKAPNDARYFLFFGVFLRSIGLDDAALQNFNHALELSPQKQTILFELAATYIQKKEYATGLSYFKRAYELEPNFTDARVLYGVGALYANDNKLANDLFGTLSAKDVLMDDRIVRALVATGRYPELIQIFTRRILEGQDTLDNTISLAVSYLRDGQRAKSIETLRRFADKDPKYKVELERYIKEIEAGKTP